MKNPLTEARRWYDQAWNDWEFVRWLSAEDKFYDKGCFLAQQAAEKMLKACLFACEERFIPLHATMDLVEKLIGLHAVFSNVLDAAKRLDRFYIPTRYPNGLPGGVPYKHFTKGDFDQALADTEKIVTLCQDFLRGKGVEL